MIERILYVAAAIATIAAFLLEVWRTWKDEREKKRADDLERKPGQQ